MYSGRWRPAWRKSHTGVRSTFSPFAARIIVSFAGFAFAEGFRRRLRGLSRARAVRRRSREGSESGQASERVLGTGAVVCEEDNRKHRKGRRGRTHRRGERADARRGAETRGATAAGLSVADIDAARQTWLTRGRGELECTRTRTTSHLYRIANSDLRQSANQLPTPRRQGKQSETLPFVKTPELEKLREAVGVLAFTAGVAWCDTPPAAMPRPQRPRAAEQATQPRETRVEKHPGQAQGVRGRCAAPPYHQGEPPPAAAAATAGGVSPSRFVVVARGTASSPHPSHETDARLSPPSPSLVSLPGTASSPLPSDRRGRRERARSARFARSSFATRVAWRSSRRGARRGAPRRSSRSSR